jgi:two-component system LytT family sensor kinase
MLLNFKQCYAVLRTVASHWVWWLLYIIYELFIFYYSTGRISGIAKYLLFYGLNIILFYVHYYVLSSALGGNRNRYVRLAVLVIAELSVFLTIKVAFDLLYLQAERPQDDQWLMIRKLAALDLYRSLFFVGLSSLYWAASNISNFERRTKEAEIRQLTSARDALALEARLARSENALLRQQINPHLLFNSLNAIHSTVYKVSEEAAETVIMLSDILRFSMTEADEDGKIFLKDEIGQISNLIAINRARYKKTANIDFTVWGDPAGHRIIPLVLMTLVENVFKHGNFIEQEVIIRLELSNKGSLMFYTRNKVKAKAPFPRLKSTGLENIRIRLDYAYGDAYELKTREHDGIFESELILQL